MHVSDLSPKDQKLFSFFEFDANEELICEVRKHPFGLFVIYATGVLIGASLFIIFVLGPLLARDSSLGPNDSTLRTASVLIGGVLTTLAVVMTAIGVYLYSSNVMFVTSEKIAQVLYKSIFDRKISQLSIGDVQDVTVVQTGVFARIFKYGTIVIETAGEQQNYTFTFAPEPYENAKRIIGAHERDVARHGN